MEQHNMSPLIKHSVLLENKIESAKTAITAVNTLPLLKLLSECVHKVCTIRANVPPVASCSSLVCLHHLVTRFDVNSGLVFTDRYHNRWFTNSKAPLQSVLKVVLQYNGGLWGPEGGTGWLKNEMQKKKSSFKTQLFQRVMFSFVCVDVLWELWRVLALFLL